jgi:hypothetical protein
MTSIANRYQKAEAKKTEKATHPDWQENSKGEPASKQAVKEFIERTIEKRKVEPIHGPYLTPEELGEALGIPDFPKLLQKRKEHLAYHAAYQRDLRTIKRQGLNITVKAYRESLNGKS